jgi:NADPH2:quinone reductase
MLPSMQTNAARLLAHHQVQVQAVDVRTPAEDEVVVEMAFAAVNPVDLYMSQGAVAPDGPLPRTLGSEGAGMLDGRKVIVHGHGFGAARDGTWAGALVAPASSVVAVPDAVPLEQAASLGVAGATAIRCVEDLAKVSADDRVLVLGAAGGVGSFITSLARAKGAAVAGQTSTPAKADFITEAGAEHVLIGDANAIADGAAAFHPTVVFDPLGGLFTGTALAALNPGGRLVLFGTSAGVAGEVPLRELYRNGITVHGYAGLRDDPATLAEATTRALDAVVSGALKVHIDRAVPLGDVVGALQAVANREVRGKLVLQLN